jgi:hypothetical protein
MLFNLTTLLTGNLGTFLPGDIGALLPGNLNGDIGADGLQDI